MKTIHLSPHVTIFQSALYQTNATLIDLENAVILFDPCWLPEEIKTIQSVVKTFALELALDNIRVNAIAPGPTRTPTASLDDDPQRLRRGIPMGRHGRADEIAGPTLFLLSDLSTFMTGQCLTVDGGCNIKWCHLTDDNLPMFLKDASVAQAIKGSP